MAAGPWRYRLACARRNPPGPSFSYLSSYRRAAAMPSVPQVVVGFWAALYTFLMPQHFLTPMELLKGVSSGRDRRLLRALVCLT